MIGTFITVLKLSHIKFHVNDVRLKRKKIDQSQSSIVLSITPLLDWDWSIFLRVHFTSLRSFMCDSLMILNVYRSFQKLRAEILTVYRMSSSYTC